MMQAKNTNDLQALAAVVNEESKTRANHIIIMLVLIYSRHLKQVWNINFITSSNII